MKTISTILLCLLMLTLFSCHQDEFTSPGTIVLDEKSAELIEAENEFGLELFQKIYAQEEKYDNIMVSPLSVSLALAMTYNGANGETQTAMEETLKVYGLTPDEINESYATLVEALKSLDPKVVLEIANAIYYREDFSVEDDFITTNRNYYDAEVEALDFNATEQALKTINNWVADKTHDKIDKILDNISGDQVMFLLNAIYFNGIWQTKFDKDDTEDLPFYLEIGSAINVPTMKKTESLPYYSNSLYSAVKLAYGAGNYNMFVFLPNAENTVEDIVNELSTSSWESWMENFTDSVNLDLQLPRLKYKYEIKLNEVLSDMGMGIAFTSGADFTGINKAGGLNIDYVKHKTFIEVNEKGTEAAAVTIVAIELTAVGSGNLQFKVNRPFLYAITEKDTGAILFMGTVKNPEKEG